MNNLLKVRLNQLNDNINKDLELLNEYEKKLRLEDDPKRKELCKISIKELRESALAYSQEYKQLEEVISKELLVSNEEISELTIIQEKLNMLLKGQKKTHEKLSKTKELILERYTELENKIVFQVVDALNQEESRIVNQILETMEQKSFDNMEIVNKINNNLHDILIGLNRVDIPNTEKIERLISDPKIASKQKLKFIIPIIPLLLRYEQEVELSIDMNLQKVWNSLKNKIN